MKSCPKCFALNVPTAQACKKCHLPFDLTAVNLSRTCPAGRHVMDPTWTVCAFCKAEGLVTDDLTPNASFVPGSAAPSPRKTLYEELTAPGGTLIDPKRGQDRTPNPPNGRKTRLDHSPALPLHHAGSPNADPQRPPASFQKTKFGVPGAPTATADGRRIVGMLISYTWKSEGQIFPLREGRNWIGRDPLQADIAIEEDETLSAVNSTILFRTRFVIGDKDSMGGTYVNGEPVEESSFPLPNYARIRTGSTTWTFIAIEPATAP